MTEPELRAQRLRAAAFVGTTAAVLVGAVLVLGRSQSLFARRATLHTSFADVGGLIAGAEVRLAGLQVGTVRRIHFDRDPRLQRVDVDLSVAASQLDRIRADSVAHIASKGLLGDMIVDVTVGSEDRPALRDGDDLPSEEVAGLPEVVDGLKHAVSSVDRLAGDVDERVRETLTPQVAADVARLTRSAADAAEAVANGPGLAHGLLHDPALAGDARRALARLDDTAAHLDAAAAAAEALLAQARGGDGALHALIYEPGGRRTVADLQRAAASLADGAHELDRAAPVVRRLVVEADQGKGTVGGLLKDPTLYEKLTQLFGNLERNVLLKALIRASAGKPPTLPAQGGGGG